MDTFFGDDSSSEEEFVDIKKSLAKRNKADGQKVSKRTKIQLEKALKEDKNIFEFDKFLEDSSVNDHEKKDDGEDKGESKYISQMMEKAEERKRDYKILVEKRIQKEMEKEKEKLGDVQVFVTNAYKEKLKEDEKWKLERESDEPSNVDTQVSEPPSLVTNQNKLEIIPPPPLVEKREKDSTLEKVEEIGIVRRKRKISEILDDSEPHKDKAAKITKEDYISKARERYLQRLEERRKKEMEEESR